MLWRPVGNDASVNPQMVSKVRQSNRDWHRLAPVIQMLGSCLVKSAWETGANPNPRR